MLLTRESETVQVGAVTGHDLEARTITVRLCRWLNPRPVADPDGARYREQHAPGSIELDENVHVVDRHLGALIGRADPATLTDDGDGPTVDVMIARSSAGNDLLANVDAGVIRAVSMELEPVTADTGRDGIVTRTRSIVHGIAFTFRPAHDAPILAVRETLNGEPVMSDTDTIRETSPVPDPSPPAVELVDAATLNRAIEDVRREIVTRTVPDGGHPLARFRSLEEFTTAAYTDGTLPGLLNRALADQITTNNPGVVPPGWLSEVFGIVDLGRPAVTAFGTAPLPASGMEIDWPYFDGDLSTLVGKQATEKTPITSVRVDLKRGSVVLETYAGGSDLSYQLIRRSSPSYRDAYMRIMFAAYAAVTGAAASAKAVAAATGALTYSGVSDPDGKVLAGTLVEASTMVAAATGSPATFVLASTDAFIALGGMLTPSTYGTSNVAGTATASTLDISVSGLKIIHDPYLAASTLLVSNGQAGSWFEDGPMTVAAEDVEKLGQNVAVWGMANFGAPIPAGIVKITATLPAGTSTSSKKS